MKTGRLGRSICLSFYSPDNSIIHLPAADDAFASFITKRKCSFRETSRSWTQQLPKNSSTNSCGSVQSLAMEEAKKCPEDQATQRFPTTFLFQIKFLFPAGEVKERPRTFLPRLTPPTTTTSTSSLPPQCSLFTCNSSDSREEARHSGEASSG